MIRIIEGLPDGLFGLEARGAVSADEIDDAMLAFAETVRRRYDVALLLDFGPRTSLPDSPSDQSFYNRLEFRGPVRRVALVAAPEWEFRLDELLGFIGCEGRRFPPRQRKVAIAWLLRSVTDAESTP